MKEYYLKNLDKETNITGYNFFVSTEYEIASRPYRCDAVVTDEAADIMLGTQVSL